jgi:lysophospholipase L1-like esterase
MMPARKKILRRLLAASLILLCLLAALEAGLRLSGWVIRSNQTDSNPELDYRPDEFRIVVLGESTSAQFWTAGRPTSWAAQLEKNLNAAGLGRRFKVINLAVGGTSTPFLLRELEASRHWIKPHAVITMMGINDNLGLEYLHASSLRIVKLWGWLRSAISPPPSAPLVDHADFRRLLDEMNSGPWVRARRPADLVFAPDFIEAAARRDERLRWLVYHLAAHGHLARYNQLKEEKDSPQIKKTIDVLLDSCRRYAHLSRGLNPLDPRTLRSIVYCSAPDRRTHAAARRALRSSITAGALLDGPIITTLRRIGGLQDPLFLRELKRHDVRYAPSRSKLELTRDSYRLLADRLKAEGVAFLAMQYPTGNSDAIRNYFASNPRTDYRYHGEALHGHFPGLEVLPRYADVFVLGNENFKEAVAARGYSHYFTDRFAGTFGHMTNAGHALVARNAADFIIAHWPAISVYSPISR